MSRGPLWRRLVLPIVILVVSVSSILRAPGGLVAAWPLSRGMIASLLPIAAGAIVIAGIAAAMVAWRRERRGDA